MFPKRQTTAERVIRQQGSELAGSEKLVAKMIPDLPSMW